jgi:hypothetical protein
MRPSPRELSLHELFSGDWSESNSWAIVMIDETPPVDVALTRL